MLALVSEMVLNAMVDLLHRAWNLAYVSTGIVQRAIDCLSYFIIWFW